ncbi:hypothetical protein ABZY09_30600 [Streptomyces sp. NPDC002928]|uniref:hypothetical protein n=1 Tax=Streptomyces sp. NPDC002928 TaxID=3154440 RepID=UPI0033A8B24C
MSTPAEQTVPDDFQDTLDLPIPGQVDQAAVTKAQQDLAAAKANSSSYSGKLKAANAQITALQQRLKAKGLSAASKAVLNTRIATQQRLVKQYTMQQTAATTKATTLQNTVYEVSGQYDKLLSGDNRDAFLALKSLFGQYGLDSLAGKIYDYVKQGYGADTISTLLQDTSEYKARFAGNEARAKAGLAVLSPADYLATEAAYRQVLSAAGLPKGFYDNPADFTKWISDDVSATEIKSRVDLAVAATGQANQSYKDALFSMYGINESDLTAYFLDRKRAEPILKKQAAAGAIGAAALRRGFAANTLDLEGYATLGITADQAEQAYAQIASGFEDMLGIAGRYGSSWSQQEAEQEVFTPGSLNGDQEAASEKSKRLKSQERALFAGSKGSSVQGLNAGFSAT